MFNSTLSGILKADFSGFPYFYGLLIGTRARGEERIVAAKCLILREEGLARAKEEIESDACPVNDTDFKDEVTESELGEYRWRLLKYYFNGIDRSDGPECL